MNAKEFLVLADQLAAFTVVMRGDLAKETAEAKAALKALGDAKGIAASLAKLEQEKEKHEQYKGHVEEQHALITETHVATEQSLFAREAALVEAEKAAKASQEELEADKVTLEQAQASYVELVKKQQEDLEFVRTQVEQDRIALDKAFSSIAARELAVSKKLAAMKAIV